MSTWETSRHRKVEDFWRTISTNQQPARLTLVRVWHQTLTWRNWGNCLIQPPKPVPDPLNPYIRTMPKSLTVIKQQSARRRRWHREGAVMWCVQQLRLGFVDESFPCQNTLPKCSAFNASSLRASVNTFDFGRDVNSALDERGCPGRRCLLFCRCSVKLLAPPSHNLSLGEGGGRVTPLRQTMGLRQRGCRDDPCLLGHIVKGFAFFLLFF